MKEVRTPEALKRYMTEAGSASWECDICSCTRPRAQKGPALSLMLCFCFLKYLIIFEQWACVFFSGPCKYVASTNLRPSERATFGWGSWLVRKTHTSSFASGVPWANYRVGNGPDCILHTGCIDLENNDYFSRTCERKGNRMKMDAFFLLVHCILHNLKWISQMNF